MAETPQQRRDRLAEEGTSPVLVDNHHQQFREKVRKALLQAIDPDMVISYNNEPMTIREVPDPSIRALLGFGHVPVDIRAREKFSRPDAKPWAYTPESCLIASEITGVWIDADHLCCPGCGLDYT